MSADRDVEKNYTLSVFIAELRRLADALEAGGPFEIEIDGEHILVPGTAAVSVEHERENGREEVEFQLVWNAADADGGDADDGDAEDSAESADKSADAPAASEETPASA